MKQDYKIYLNNVKFNYGERIVIDNLSFGIEKEKITALLGISGSGKSTLVKLCSGLIKPTSGERIYQISDREDRIGIIFQDSTLLPWKNIEQNLLISRPQGKSEPDLLTVAHQVGIADALHKYPDQLSGGMKQRAEFGRLMMLRPNLIFLDEPFNSLDIHFQKSIHKIFLRIQDEFSPTTLLVTHDINEAWNLAHQVILLKGIPPNEVYKFSKDIKREDEQKNKIYRMLEHEFEKYGCY